jgi:hypothetical protein
MFVDGYYTYENFMDAATRSLQAVEAALRVRLDAGTRPSFNALIKRARNEHLADEETYEVLDAGRYLRNSQIHATNLPAFPPVMAAQMIATSHKLVAEIFRQ